MDELFDKLKDGASKAKDGAERIAKEVAKRTSNVITNTKLSYLINESNSKINDVYTLIGKEMYKKYLDGELVDSEFEEKFEQIDKLMKDIDSINEKKAELKNSLRCAECGTFNPLTSDYCSKCGAELSHDIPTEDDEDAVYDAEDIITIDPQED